MSRWGPEIPQASNREGTVLAGGRRPGAQHVRGFMSSGTTIFGRQPKSDYRKGTSEVAAFTTYTETRGMSLCGRFETLETGISDISGE